MNFNFWGEQNIFLVIYIVLAIGIVWIIIDIFKILKKKKKEFFSSKGFTKNELLLRISQEFYNQLKKSIEEEIKNTLLEFRKEVEKTSQEIIKSYQIQFEKEREEIKKIFPGISQQIIIEAEEAKRQIEIFGQKIQEEIFQLSKFNLETQKRISENAENKIFQLNDLTKMEITKIEKINLKNQELLVDELKKQYEISAREISQKISQFYQLAEEIIKERVRKTEKEIEDYKKEKFKEMDRKIYLMLSEVAKKTIGKGIDLSTHEKLVMEALEKAKKEIF